MPGWWIWVRLGAELTGAAVFVIHAWQAYGAADGWAVLWSVLGCLYFFGLFIADTGRVARG